MSPLPRHPRRCSRPFPSLTGRYGLRPGSRRGVTLAVLLGSLLGPTSPAEPPTDLPFTRITDDPVLSAVTRAAFGAAWGDVDRDGRPDLYLAGLDPGPGVLLLNRPAGFADVDEGPVVTDRAQRAGAAWGDLDGDGALDLFVVNAYGETDFLYRNAGGGVLEPVPGPATTAPTIGISAVWVDFDHDGRLDLFVVTGGGSGEQPNHLYRNEGGTRLVRVLDNPVAAESRYSHGAAFADFTGDGWIDLVVANTYGPPSFFRNDGRGAFAALAGTPEAPDPESLPQNATIPVFADFDNDGDLDLFLPTGLDLNSYYRNEGDGRLVSVSLPPVTTQGGDCAGAVAEDFDNDGWLDLFVSSRSGAHRLFHGLGGGEFELERFSGLVLVGRNADGIAAADYDLDGDVDLVLANWPDFGPSHLYRNDASGNAWLRIRLVGTRSNRDGIGARLRATSELEGSTPHRQLRQVGGFDSAGSHELIAHFGLGQATSVSELRIEWPSGIVQTLTDLAPNQVLTVTEQELTPLGDLTLNRQTGLLEHRVRFAPGRYPEGSRVRIVARGLPEGVRWTQSTGTNALGPHLDLDPGSVPAAGEAVTLTFTFFHPRRTVFVPPVYEAVYGPWSTPLPPSGPTLAIERTVPLPDGSLLIEFASTPGLRYAIEYGSEPNVWLNVPGTILAGGTRTQWIDAGPPATPALPGTTGTRFYRVIQLSAP
jgi:hypothetical protein